MLGFTINRLVKEARNLSTTSAYIFVDNHLDITGAQRASDRGNEEDADMGLIKLFIDLIVGFIGLVIGLVGGLIGLVFGIVGSAVGLVLAVVGLVILCPLVILALALIF